MKKRAIIISAAMAAVLLLTAFTENVMRYDAYKTEEKIFFDGEEIKYDEPVVKINGMIYVPLRETEEKRGGTVHWHGENLGRVEVTSKNFDAEQLFEQIFQFELPESAQIENYSYYFVRDDLIPENKEVEEYFVGKISFEEKDLEYIKQGIDLLALEETELDREDWDYNLRIFIRKYNEKFDWWKLSRKEDVKHYYAGTTSGKFIKSRVREHLITDAPEGKYYLYAIYD